MGRKSLYLVGEYVAGIATAVLAALPIHALVDPGWDVVAVRSRLAPLAIVQDLMMPPTRRLGPDMNRDTVANAGRAGFRVVREENVYLDLMKAIEAVPL